MLYPQAEPKKVNLCCLWSLRCRHIVFSRSTWSHDLLQWVIGL